MNQNSGLWNNIDALKLEKDRLVKEKEETIKTYIELVDQTFEWNNDKDNEKLEEIKHENEKIKKEITEHLSLITDLQLELSDFKKENTSLQRMLSESWTNKNDLQEAQASMSKSASISTGLLSVGQRRLFIKDPDADFVRYIPTIFDVDEDEMNPEMSKTNRW